MQWSDPPGLGAEEDCDEEGDVTFEDGAVFEQEDGQEAFEEDQVLEGEADGFTPRAGRGIAARYLLVDMPEELDEAEVHAYFGQLGDIEEVTKKVTRKGRVMGSIKFANPTPELQQCMLNEKHLVLGVPMLIQTWKMQKMQRPGWFEMQKGKKGGKGSKFDSDGVAARKGGKDRLRPVGAEPEDYPPPRSMTRYGDRRNLEPSSYAPVRRARAEPIPEDPEEAWLRNRYRRPEGRAPVVHGRVYGQPPVDDFMDEPREGYAFSRRNAFGSSPQRALGPYGRRPPEEDHRGFGISDEKGKGKGKGKKGKKGKDVEVAARYLLVDLPPETTEQELVDYFSAIGEVEEITVRQLDNGRTMGSVKFYNPTFAIRNTMLDEEHEIQGCPILVQTHKMQKISRQSALIEKGILPPEKGGKGF